MRQYEAQPVRRHALAPSVGGEDLAHLGGLPHIEAGPRNKQLGEAAEGEGVAGRGDGAGRGGAAAVVAGRPAGNGWPGEGGESELGTQAAASLTHTVTPVS